MSGAPTQAALLELAARVEAASGPDRELDAAIAYQHLGFFVRDEGHPLGRKCYDTHGIEVQLPRYTAFLDAAMTLVPEGAGFNLDRYWIREGVRWKVEIATGGVPENPRQVFDCWDAYSAPLAVCAAALRARAAQGDPA